MKRVLYITALLLVFSILNPADVSGQCSLEEISDDLHYARSHYSVYPVPSGTVSPAPKDYEPVYMSHYGRHGSRYHSSLTQYKAADKALSEAAAEGNLTDFGVHLYERISLMRKDAEGRAGGLTGLGVNEHRGIAERMYESFPEIFGKDDTIICRSTDTPRCILSMAAANERLRELQPALNIVRTAYDIDSDILRNDGYLNPLRREISQIRRSYLAGSGLDCAAFAGRVFKDVRMDESACLSFMLDIYAMYQIAGCTSHLGISLDDVFTSDELFLLWQGQNWRNYLQCGNSAQYGDGVLSDAEVLLMDIVSYADEALAGNGVSADLRFGHDIALAPLLALMDLNGLGARVAQADSVYLKWSDFKVMPMGANLQMVFYRHKRNDRVIVRLLHNERDASLPLPTDNFPFYDWNDVRKYFLEKVDDRLNEDSFPSKWIFSKEYIPEFEKEWKEGHILPATEAGAGTIMALTSDGQHLGRYDIVDKRPIAGPFKKGDQMLFDFPVSYLPAGTVISFDAAVTAEKGAPKRWQIEWTDGGEWKQGKSFNIYGPAFGKNHKYSTVYETFRLSEPVKDGSVKIRLKAIGDELIANGEEAGAGLMLVTYGYVGAYAQNYGTSVPKDTLKVLCLGNSFTYYNSCPTLLKEIAWNEGHYIDIYAGLKGSRTMAHHLELEMTDEWIALGGYDYVFLQDQSQIPAKVGKDRKENRQQIQDMAAVAAKVRSRSPECKAVVEWTWAYPAREFGGFDNYDAFSRYGRKGSYIMAKAVGNAVVSPIEKAFKIVREERPDICLYHTDGLHQSLYGSYLKSCVNYLLIYGEPFGNSPADCLVEPAIAAYLRKVAEKVVL